MVRWDMETVAYSFYLCPFLLLLPPSPSAGPPCRAFTPSLIEAYKAAKAAGVDFELIFVSSDQDEDGFDEYYSSMPFPAVKYSNDELREALGTAFGVRGIPSLQVVGKDGKIITTDGRTTVTKDADKAFVAWSAL